MAVLTCASRCRREIVISHLRRTAFPISTTEEIHHDPLAESGLYANCLSRTRADVCSRRGPGTIPTHHLGFESSGSGKTHGSAAGKCLGTGLRSGKSILDQRQWLRLVNAILRQRRQSALPGGDSLRERL